MSATHTDAVIVLTMGKQDRGARATLAFSWGCTALAMGQSVSLFLTMDGAIWAATGAAKGVSVAGFEPLGAYVDQFLELGGQLLVCAPCSEYYCGVKGQADLGQMVSRAQLSGLATVVSKIGPDTTMVTF